MQAESRDWNFKSGGWDLNERQKLVLIALTAVVKLVCVLLHSQSSQPKVQMTTNNDGPSRGEGEGGGLPIFFLAKYNFSPWQEQTQRERKDPLYGGSERYLLIVTTVKQLSARLHTSSEHVGCRSWESLAPGMGGLLITLSWAAIFCGKTPFQTACVCSFQMRDERRDALETWSVRIILGGEGCWIFSGPPHLACLNFCCHALVQCRSVWICCREGSLSICSFAHRPAFVLANMALQQASHLQPD